MNKTACLSIALNTITLLLLESGSHVASAETITLILNNSDKIQGTLVKGESTDNVTFIEHPSLGKLEIQSTSLKPKPKMRWTGSFSAGITGSNTDRDQDLDSTSQLITQYKDEANLFSFKTNIEYSFSRSDGKKGGSIDTNQGQLDLRYSYTFSGKTIAYITNTYDYDTLNKEDANNLVNSIGAGHNLIRTDTTTLNISVGPSVQSISTVLI